MCVGLEMINDQISGIQRQNEDDFFSLFSLRHCHCIAPVHYADATATTIFNVFFFMYRYSEQQISKILISSTVPFIHLCKSYSCSLVLKKMFYTEQPPTQHWWWGQLETRNRELISFTEQHYPSIYYPAHAAFVTQQKQRNNKVVNLTSHDTHNCTNASGCKASTFKVESKFLFCSVQQRNNLWRWYKYMLVDILRFFCFVEEIEDDDDYTMSL